MMVFRFETTHCCTLVGEADRRSQNYDMPNDVDEYVHRIGRTGEQSATIWCPPVHPPVLAGSSGVFWCARVHLVPDCSSGARRFGGAGAGHGWQRTCAIERLTA